MSHNHEYMNVLVSDLLEAKIITKKQWQWLDQLRIPYLDKQGMWIEKHIIDCQIMKAIASGVVKEIERKPAQRSISHYVISDDLGIQGIMNHANGKKYDSKSQYYRAVKEAGCVVLGNDAPREAKPLEYKICEKELKRDIAKSIEQLGG